MVPYPGTPSIHKPSRRFDVSGKWGVPRSPVHQWSANGHVLTHSKHRRFDKKVPIRAGVVQSSQPGAGTVSDLGKSVTSLEKRIEALERAVAESREEVASVRNRDIPLPKGAFRKLVETASNRCTNVPWLPERSPNGSTGPRPGSARSSHDLLH